MKKSVFARIKKNCGFVVKWISEIAFKKTKIISDFDENSAWEYINRIRSHNYHNDSKYLNFKFEKPQIDLSVIVPVYNTEKYLRQAVESIISSADGLDYEIILVEDNSTDNSLDLCRKLCNEYQRIQLYQSCEIGEQDSSGVSVARNKGLYFSRGRYILFVDSDDLCIDVKSLYNIAEHNKADIVEGNFAIFQDDTNINLMDKHMQRKNFGPAYISNDYNKLSMCSGFVWGKLFSREMWRGVRFPEGFIFEDTVIETVLLRKSQRYVFSNIVCYAYRQNPTSICHTVNTTSRVLDTILVYKYWIDNLPIELKDDIFKRFVIRQFGTRSASRISALPDKDLHCALTIMKSMLVDIGKVKKMNAYERILANSILTGNIDKWKFICKYCFV